MSNESDFEQWAEQRGLSTTKCDWYGDIYESEATLYAYMGWEARQKEIDTLKAQIDFLNKKIETLSKEYDKLQSKYVNSTYQVI